MKDQTQESLNLMGKTVVSKVDTLPTRGVDEDAINCIQDLSAFMRHSVQYNEESNRGASIEDILLIVKGEALGRATDLQSEKRAISKQLQDAMSKASRTRGILSSRYNIEFPSLLD